MSEPFWETTSLEDMNEQQWEALCDGCGKCCLHKFIDDDEAEEAAPTSHINANEHVHFTNIACSLLNTKTCSCSQYFQRTQLVPDCVKLTKENLKDIFFMPPSCSYRRLHEGRGLPSWHPLLNRGKKTAMHKSGMSIRGKTVFETDVNLEEFEEYIAIWPLEDID
ncbi:YcgN family cysteine cluster protein [Alteromonas pelagimontana]|uniref:YcgN family cysteine cluster protein n=1 Tax=Alteromonas pelagimontana TaxID=1858656 RepID=A0A6M4MHY4_9ALTE|nr:YcgN family cysteine cluster protein [Alteromonas pelagimontana]QJR82205.1 YcgN family cysteine cluster protein [Alteromonas pelagimontana]